MNRELVRSYKTFDDINDTQQNTVRSSVPTTSKVNYYTVRNGTDPFPDRSLLDLIDSKQHDDIIQKVTKMVDFAV